jgi:threonine synthase
VPKVTSLTCVSCAASRSPRPTTHSCPACDGMLDVVYDYDSMDGGAFDRRLSVNRDRSMWRYGQLLPCEGRSERGCRKG